MDGSEFGPLVKMLEPDQMLKELSRITGEDRRFDRMYQYLANARGGKELYAFGLVNMFALEAIPHFVEPDAQEDALRLIPQWFEALVDDVEVLERANTLYRRAMQETGRA